MANLMTPEAPCVWPFLNKPDTRFDKDGKYRTSLVFDQDDEFPKQIEADARASFEEIKKGMKPKDAKNLPFTSPVKEEQDEEGEPTGNVLIEFSTRAYFKRDGVIKPIKLKAFDSFGRKITKIPNVGSGSELVIAYKPDGKVVSGKFFYTLYLNAFQIVKLVEFGGDFGFTKKEGGFNADSLEADDADDTVADGEEY